MRKLLCIVFLNLVLCSSISAVERIIDTSNGNDVTLEALVNKLSNQEFILLGELHDNEQHHQQRGELIVALKSLAPTVVAEHLERGNIFIFNDDLKDNLVLAGFDPKGWRWPLHEALFSAIAKAEITLLGGNIPREIAKKIVREGNDAFPSELLGIIEQAPLDESAKNNLDADLLNSHCGHINAPMLPGLQLAQRARDASMFNAMEQASKPVILVAGNGHVRLDYGIPSLLRQYQPQSNFVSIGFIEDSVDLSDMDKLRAQYHYLWVTPKIERKDPCIGFKISETDKASNK